MEPIEKGFSFRGVLSFKRLVEDVRNSVTHSHGEHPMPGEDFDSLLRQTPEISRPMEDPTTFDGHGEIVAKLMGLVFPFSRWETDLYAAVIPFSMEPFFVAPQFGRLFLDDNRKFKGRLNLEDELFHRGRLIRAYLFILEKFYGIRQRFDYPVIYIVEDPETGLERHFKMNMDFRFVEAHAITPPRTLSEGEIDFILNHLSEPEMLKEIIPPENFELHGFTLLHAVDVTESEVMSAIERDLIDQESLISQGGFLRLQQRMRTFFRRPDLVAGLAAIREDQVLLLNKGCNILESCIFSDTLHLPLEEFRGSVYEMSVENEQVYWFADLRERLPRTSVEEELVQGGIRSFLIVPLRYKGKLIGTLDIGSPRPGDLGPMDALLASQIQPLFSMAIKNALDDFEHHIEGVIKEKCTVIHPTVEWRFRKAALRHLDSLRMGRLSEIEEIVFPEVFPLYGASDIRGSTDKRNRALQEDLAKHLNLALAVIRSADNVKPMLILQELAGRIASHLERIEKAPGTGDEFAIAQFLRQEVESVFPHLTESHPSVKRAIDVYKMTVDPLKGTVYKLRKDFDESISVLSERLSSYVDQEEHELQRTIPHYFEKHRTDGVDYLIYGGASLLERPQFCELYLKHLRLWQLRLACGMAWHMEQLKSTLPIPLETAHLVLVQSTPISICFRFDEKRFDVEGAYDTRYEIIKSRIDKAVVRGGEERVTQPGKIAVVYSHPQEAKEMRLHIDFLRKEGLLTGKTEALELEDLSGLHGLRALRVTINLDSPPFASSGMHGESQDLRESP